MKETGMNLDKIKGRLAFLREAEKLKSVLRSAHTAAGRPESTAEHSWRLCLMAIAFEDELTGLDLSRILKLCVIHDLGEAISGDIPAVNKASFPDKSEQEKNDLLLLTQALDAPLRDDILALWDDYEHGRSAEAQAVKALDKLETILQHTQGANPPDFNYAFNLTYGKRYTDATPLFQTLRALIDQDTKERIGMNIAIRKEQPQDTETIARLTEAAFRDTEHSSHTEHFIVDALRRAGQLSLSLVAEENGAIVGHVALSPVTVSDGTTGWYGLGPISVWPERHGQGIGAALMKAALSELRELGGAGCVLLGDPGYYGRFGFKPHPGLELPGVPAEYFQALALGDAVPTGVVRYHEAFDATE